MSKLRIRAQTVRGQEVRIKVESYPQACPRCHGGIDALACGGFAYPEDDIQGVTVAFLCPRCERPFMGVYERRGVLAFSTGLSLARVEPQASRRA